MKPRRGAEDLKAIAHPVRVQILRCVQGGVTSPVKVFAELVKQDSSLSLGQVSYHFQILAQLGVIACHKQVKVRGTFEHFYKLTVRGKYLVKAIGDL